MTDHGLEPSQFVISKDRATPATVPLIGPFFYDYTVFFGDEHFTVTEPNDILVPGVFSPALHRRGCLSLREPRPGLISRIFRWMAQPILYSHHHGARGRGAPESRTPAALPAPPARSLRSSARP